MRNYFNAVMVGLLLMGCSVDNDETNFDYQLLIANSVIDVEGCMPDTYNLYNTSEEKIGEFIVTNDENEVYLNFTSVNGYDISMINYEVALSEDDLPMNNGGIIVGQLENTVKFSATTNYYGDSVSFESFGENPTALVVAARIQFINESKKTYAVWIGDQIAGKNNSKFLNYSICIPQQEEVCEVDAGSDNSASYTVEEVDALVNSIGDADRLFKSLLDEDVSRNGVFEPTISTLLARFSANPVRDFTTTYTVTNELNGEVCTDSTVLTITVTE